MSSVRGRVLVVDDDPKFLDDFSKVLAIRHIDVLTAKNAEEGFKILAEKPVDVVLSDQRMPGIKGSDFLAGVAEGYPKVVRILITGYSDLEPAIEAINKAKVRSYISKSEEPEKMAKIVLEAIEYRQVLLDLEATKKRREKGPSATSALEMVNVAVITDNEKGYTNFYHLLTLFQIPVTVVKPSNVDASIYDRQRFRVIFQDVDGVNLATLPARTWDDRKNPFIIAISSNRHDVLPVLKEKGFYDCLDKKMLENAADIGDYLMNLPAIGGPFFERRSFK